MTTLPLLLPSSLSSPLSLSFVPSASIVAWLVRRTEQRCLSFSIYSRGGCSFCRALRSSTKRQVQSCPQPVVTCFHHWRLSEDQNIDHYINSSHNYYLKLISVMKSTSGEMLTMYLRLLVNKFYLFH